MDPTDRRKKLLSLLTWVNSLETDHKISDLSQLSNGSVLAQCLRLLGFLPDISINQSPLEFVLSTLSDFYGCDLAKCGVLQLSGIQAGKEEEIARVLVLLLCMAVKHSENENFIEAILTFPNDVKFDLKYFIETTMEQIDSGGLTSGDFVLGFDGTHSTNSTPMCNSWSSSKPCYSFASPALQKWLCSPSVSEEVTPKISNNQLFESLEVKELKHQLKLIKKELEMQRSLVTDMEGENELLSEKYSNLTVSAAEKDEKIRQLQDKCEELEHLENVDIKLQKAEDEIKNLRQQLEFAKEESNARSELQQKITGQHKELKELYQKKNLFEVKLLTYQHQVQELELECKNQQSQSTRSLKRCNEVLERIEVLEKQNSDLQDELTKEREALETTSTSLRQQNCTLNTELTLLQEQYACIMSTVGNQGQENERLQHNLHDMEDKLDAKEQLIKLLEEQVTLLTTRVEKALMDCELQAEEFDHKEVKMRKEWEERISIQEAKSLSELSRAEEMVKSCQLTIRNLTREKDEAKLSATRQVNDLEATYKERVKTLDQKREALEATSTSLKQQNCTLNTELTLLQEQYACIMSTVGNQGQENEQLQHSLSDMEDKLDAKEWHIKALEKKVALLTTQIEKGLRDSELLMKEFDAKMEKLTKELEEKISTLEAKCLSGLSRAEEMVKSCQLTIRNLTREKDEAKLSATQQLHNLETTYKERVKALEQEREVLETTSTSLRQQNCTLNTELTLLQEQYVCIMSTVGNQGQENERLQHSLNDMEDKLDAKEQHKKLLEEQVALLTTQVEKGLRDSELHIKEFDHKEAKMRKEWEERISIQEAKSSVELSRAKEMVKSCQLSIRNLTREKDEAKLSATQQLHNLEATYKEQVKALQQEISDCKELSEQQLLWLKKHISEQELQLKETKECLQQKIEQAEQYRKTIILLEQKSNSAEFDQCEAERRHQDELRLYADELDKVNCEHGIEVLELTQQLQEVNGKYRMLVRANEELRKECTDIQSVFNKQEQDCTKSLQQCEKLNEKKDTLMLDIKQNQVVAEQQIQIIAKGLEQLRNEAKSTAKHSVIEQKKDLGEVSSFKQQNKMPLQKDVRLTGQLKQYQETDTALKQKLTFSLAEEDNNSGRFEELKARNSFHPPHLKSCYPVELQLNCGTPRSSEFQFKSADVKASGYLEFSPPHKRGMAHHQSDSPHYAKRRVSAPPTPTLQASKMHLRSYLKEERENKPPPLAFEISLDEQSRTAMDKRKSKMFQRMTATRKTKHEEQKFTATVTKPLRTRNASKKK